MTDKYTELFDILKNYTHEDWYALTKDVLEFKPLNLPIVIDSGLPDETLFFIDDLLRRKDKTVADQYSKNLVDYYVTMTQYPHNIKSFIYLHNVFAKVKPIKYRYTLEHKFTREEFLIKYKGATGEELQIDLLSTLSNLRYVRDETISTYLYNRINKYSFDKFILVSLRYVQKTDRIPFYYSYLNQLVKEKLNENNANYFIDAFKEMVYYQKGFRVIYEWVKTQYENEKFNKYLRNRFFDWINYENNQLRSEVFPFSKILLFELNKNDIVPCLTINQLLGLSLKFSFIKKEIHDYINHNLPKLDKLEDWEHGSSKMFSPYRLLPTKNIIFDSRRLNQNHSIEELKQKYKLNELEIRTAKLGENEANLFKAITNEEFLNQEIRTYG